LTGRRGSCSRSSPKTTEAHDCVPQMDLLGWSQVDDIPHAGPQLPCTWQSNVRRRSPSQKPETVQCHCGPSHRVGQGPTSLSQESRKAGNAQCLARRGETRSEPAGSLMTAAFSRTVASATNRLSCWSVRMKTVRGLALRGRRSSFWGRHGEASLNNVLDRCRPLSWQALLSCRGV
jgi:hypothetical protein